MSSIRCAHAKNSSNGGWRGQSLSTSYTLRVYAEIDTYQILNFGAIFWKRNKSLVKTFGLMNEYEGRVTHGHQDGKKGLLSLSTWAWFTAWSLTNRAPSNDKKSEGGDITAKKIELEDVSEVGSGYRRQGADSRGCHSLLGLLKVFRYRAFFIW